MSNGENRPITCAHCDERIGVYEPLRVEHPDGRVGSSSYLNLTAAQLHERPRLWHSWCFADVQAELRGMVHEHPPDCIA
jgi:hypothetical protein